MHVDVWGKHTVETYCGCAYLTISSDGITRILWVFPMRTKDKVAEDIEEDIMKGVVDQEGLSIGRLRVDGAGDFKGDFPASAQSPGINIKTTPPVYTSRQRHR